MYSLGASAQVCPAARRGRRLREKNLRRCGNLFSRWSLSLCHRRDPPSRPSGWWYDPERPPRDQRGGLFLVHPI